MAGRQCRHGPETAVAGKGAYPRRDRIGKDGISVCAVCRQVSVAKEDGGRWWISWNLQEGINFSFELSIQLNAVYCALRCWNLSKSGFSMSPFWLKYLH